MKRLNEIFEAAWAEGVHNVLFQRLFFGVLVGAFLAPLFSDSPILDSMELQMLNWRYKIADALSQEFWWPKSINEAASKIVIVAFDNDSQFELGCARFNDTLAQARLFEVISKIEESKPSIVTIDLDLRGAANHALADEMSRNRNVVLSLFGSLEGSTELPSAEFIQHAATGYRELIKETNGLVVRLPDLVDSHSSESSTEQVPSLTKAILLVLSGSTGVDYNSRLKPSYPDQYCYINYHRTRYTTYPMWRVLEPDFDPSSFKDKIVLLGSTLTTRTKDPMAAKSPFREKSSEIQIEADALATVINNDVIWSFPHNYAKQFLLIVGSLIGGLASVLPMGKRATATLLSGVVLLLLAQFSFQYWHVLLPVVAPMVIIVTGFLLGTVIFLDTGLRQRNKELAAARQMMQVRAEEERKRIAEDLHDETLPALSSIARMVDDMTSEYGASESPRKMRDRLDSTIQEMRRVINDLHPSVLETMGFVPALENLVHILERDFRISCKFSSDTSIKENDVPDFAKLQVYRIVQEALNNIRKHSEADTTEVSVNKEGEFLKIIVVDNGKGIDPAAIRPDSHGLLNIRHRAALIGASVEWIKPRNYRKGTEFVLIMHTGARAGELLKGMEGKI